MKSALSICLLAPLVAVFAVHVDAIDDEACADFSTGHCSPAKEVVLAVKKLPCKNDEDFAKCVDNCQKICQIMSGCNFFSFSHKSDECRLMQENQHNGYLGSCPVVAGPAEPTIQECDDQLAVDSCSRFTHEDCTYDGEPVFEERDVMSAAECQNLLAVIGEAFEADFFKHDRDNFNTCYFLKGQGKNCSAVNGPTHVSYLECSHKSTTTSMPTKTTPTMKTTPKVTTSKPYSTTARPSTTPAPPKTTTTTTPTPKTTTVKTTATPKTSPKYRL